MRVDVKPILILQHVECEPPGLWADFIRESGHPSRTVKLHEGQALPAPEEFSRILCLGGPMNVDEDQRYPFLPAEKRLIRQAARSGLPYFGICLGAQLLARALDAAVYKAPCEEVGWDLVDREPRVPDAVFGPELGGKLQVFQWHGDTFDVPEGAVRLHSGERVPNQSFRWGSSAYAIQFHVEVQEDLLRRWFAETDPRRPEYLRRWQERRQQLTELSRRIFSAWMSL